jgi:hypothetical protein
VEVIKPTLETSMRIYASVTVRRLLGVAALLSAASGTAVAQGPKVFFACYVPETGTVYRIKEPNTPTACGVSPARGKNGVPTPHVEFSWTDGAGAASTSDHGVLAGLTDDDHTQYLLTDGVRDAVNGFAITGNTGVGSIPATGPGTRMMWYPGKAAFRAGDAWNEWEDNLIGAYSVAMGRFPLATGDASIALGYASQATGNYAVALGNGFATGDLSFAVSKGVASGIQSAAIGFATNASGDGSFALGSWANTNGKPGAFVWGDNSSPGVSVNAAADNQFVARAARFWFGNSNNVTALPDRFIETSTGAFLSIGGTWTNSSDSSRKTGFAAIDGEEVLAKLEVMPITTWSYRDEADSVRHMGPTAQDFRTAFSLGSSDRAIATIDADGVSLAAINALVSRTAALQARVDQLEAALRARK